MCSDVSICASSGPVAAASRWCENHLCFTAASDRPICAAMSGHGVPRAPKRPSAASSRGVQYAQGPPSGSFTIGRSMLLLVSECLRVLHHRAPTADTVLPMASAMSSHLIPLFSMSRNCTSSSADHHPVGTTRRCPYLRRDLKRLDVTADGLRSGKASKSVASLAPMVSKSISL